MGKATYGTGTLFKRGRIWYVSYYVNGRQVQRSSRSNNIQDAKRLRDQILAAPVSIGIGGIEKRDPEVERATHQRNGLLVGIGAPPSRR